MATTRQKLQMVGALLVLVVVLGVLIWGPLLYPTPDPGPEIRTPSMKNLP